MAVTPDGRPIAGLLFDKDGTLFGFQATWGDWSEALIAGLLPDAPERQDDLATRIGFDRTARSFRPESPVIAGTIDDAVALMLPGLPEWSDAGLRAHLIEESLAVRPSEAVPLAPLMGRFRAAGLTLGVATNDAEEAAHAQFAGIGIAEAFDFVAGADSGHGAKPGPGPCLAFAAATGLSPGAVVMVGDSLHDLHAGRAAGMATVAVLTGVASAEDLAPHADAVLADIGDLPAWLGL
ncbi:MAG: HAD family hydrolase [Pseudomonadota bacterium]